MWRWYRAYVFPFHVCLYEISTFFNTNAIFIIRKNTKIFFHSWLCPWPWSYLSQALRPLSCQGGFQFWDEEWRLRKSSNKDWFQAVFLLQLPPPPGSGERFPFHIPPSEQISGLLRSLASLPPPVSEHLGPLQLAIWGLCVLRRWEGVGRGARRPGELQDAAHGGSCAAAAWLSLPALPVPHPCCPLSPPAALTLGWPSVLASFIRKSKLFFSFSQDSFGWPHSVASRPMSSQALKASLGLSLEKSWSGFFPLWDRLRTLGVIIPQSYVSDQRAPGPVRATTSGGTQEKLFFFYLTVCIHFAVY